MFLVCLSVRLSVRLSVCLSVRGITLIRFYGFCSKLVWRFIGGKVTSVLSLEGIGLHGGDGGGLEESYTF